MSKAKEPVYFLLVDDLEENLLALEALLRREGLVLLNARSASEALELLLQYEVALALVDVQMPVMDGFELAELMRGTERTRRVPIIFLTAGSADWQRRFRGYEAGAVDFLHKPIEADILRSKADVFFELYRQRQEVAHQRDDLALATQENARLLAESRRQGEALRLADQRKDEFLAMLAHELRNPLAPIRHAVEVLQLDESSPADEQHAREIISRQVSHMARLIDDLLDVARIARGKIQLRTEPTDLVSIVRQTAEDYRAMLTGGGLQLELQLTSQPLIVQGDPVRLAQIVGNLLHNAGKFTPAGGRITLTARAETSGSSATVSVQDTGAGIEAAELARLFEPFSQANQSLDRGKGGLGLGLALAKGLVELHGGSIAAESCGLAQGASFHVRLPLSMHPIPREAPRRQDASPSVVNAMRILVIEDNRDAARSLQLLLSRLGHEVAVAYDGESGLLSARDMRPAVVVSDLGLPGDIDGFALARQLRADPSFQDTYLIALSGYGQDEDRRKAEAAGFDHHLVKPVDFAHLSQVLLAISPRPSNGEG